MKKSHERPLRPDEGCCRLEHPDEARLGLLRDRVQQRANAVDANADLRSQRESSLGAVRVMEV